MKKSILLALITFSLIACEGNNKEGETTEEIPVTTAGALVNAVEALSKEDTTQYACSCEHKCKTKAECIEHCGEGCEKVK